MMSRVYQALSRFAALFRAKRLDRELEEELATHIELLTDEYVNKGMAPEAARREARRRFGSVASAMDAHREARSLPWGETVALDLRYAVRMLCKQPLLTSAVVVTLSIGIGSPTAAFSLLNGYVFRTPVSADPDAFFRVVRADNHGQGVATVPQYLALRSESKSARELAGWSTLPLNATLGPDDPARVAALLVTCNFFRVFGVDTPVAGRLLDASDCISALPIAVMSEDMWRNRFGGDAAVIGTSFLYGGVPVTIVGIASVPPIQREASDPDPDFVGDLLFPYTAHRELKEVSAFGRVWLKDTFPWLEVAGLLEPGISRQTATVEFQLIGQRQDQLDSSPAPSMILTDGSKWAASATMELMEVFAMVLALPALIMLVACANIASLLLVRAVSRQREMAVRLALGTSRAALVRMLLMESLIVSGLAALVGLFLVYGLPRILFLFFEPELWFGKVDALAPDWRVFAFLGLSGLLAAVLSGLTPALESLNPHLAESLQGRQGFVSRRGPSRSRRIFVGIQVAASMVLLVTAATFSLTATRFTRPDFSAENLLVAEIREEQNRNVPLSSFADSVAAIAGVRRVAYSETLPLVREDAMRIRIPGRPSDSFPLTASVSTSYFDVFAIPILIGRGFDRADAGQPAGLRPIVVSRQFARRFFGKENVLGEVVETGGSAGGARMTIIGVSGDRVTGLAGTSAALHDGSIIYELMEPTSLSGFVFMRSEDNADANTDNLRAALRELTGSAVAVERFESSLAAEVVGVRRARTLLAAMGVISLLLTIIGMIATVSSDANYRRREFAIRLALGATPLAVRKRVVLSGLRPVHVGVLFGLLASWGVLKVAESQRVLPLGSVATEPAPYVAISVLFLTVALGTLLVVAYRVGRNDPVRSLQGE